MASMHQTGIRRSPLFAVALLAALCTVAACDSAAPPATQTAPTVTVGFLLPLATESGTQARKGGELALQTLNAEAGGKVKFVARIEDDREQPGAAGTRMEALAADSSVLGVVGPISSGPAIAAADVATRQQVVLVSPLASTPALARPDDYFFRTWPSDASEAKFTSKYTRETLRLPSVVILHVGAPYGQDLARAFTAGFTAEGGTIADTIEYPPDTKSFGPIVSRIVGRSPKGLYLVGYPPDMAEILRELRSRKVTFPVISAAVASDPSVAQLAGKNVEGVIFPFPTTFDPSAGEAAMRSFAGAYKSATGQEPSFVAAQAYDATMLIGKAVTSHLDESKPPTRQVVQDAIDKTTTFNGSTGSFTFDANGDAVRQYRMFEIRDGRMMPRQ